MIYLGTYEFHYNYDSYPTTNMIYLGTYEFHKVKYLKVMSDMKSLDGMYSIAFATLA
jgi:hypothetical protein